MVVPVNPNIIRLSKTKNWDSKYVENKSNEIAINISKDLEIKKFITLFFKKNCLNVHTCKLNYFDNSLIIFVSYLQEKKSSITIKKINSVQKIVLKKTRTKGNTQRFSKNKKNLNYKNRNVSFSSFLRGKNEKNLKTKHNKKKLLEIKKRRKLVKKKLARNEKRLKKLTRITKNFYNYSILNYRKEFEKDLKKINMKNSINTTLSRNFSLRIYKKYLSLKKNKNINTIKNNSIFNNLFNSLNLFLKNAYYIKLIIKPLTNKVKNMLTKKQHRLLKSGLIAFRYYRKHDFFKDGISLIHALISQKNSSMFLSKYIAYYIMKFKQHNLFLKFVQSILRFFLNYRFFPVIKSIQIKIKGRINAAPRTKRRKIILGRSMPILSFDSKINYNEAISYTRNGTMSIKVWVLEKTKP